MKAMKAGSSPAKITVRCAIYTRVSTENGLDQEFNSLDAQYEASQCLYQKSGSCWLGPGQNSL